MDLPYIGLLVRNLRQRPRAEILETAALMTLSVTVIVSAAFAGHLWTLALIYLIPERAAMFVLAWWFDWLPHHDLEDTQRENRYRATRARVGMEWLFTPLDAVAELPLGAPPAPVGAVLPVCEDVAAQRGGLPRAQRRDLHGLRSTAEPRRVPGVEGAQSQAGTGVAGPDAGSVERYARGRTASRWPRSTPSPPTARW